MRRRRVFLYNMVTLFILYSVIAGLFCLVYISLDLAGLGSVVDHYASASDPGLCMDLIIRSFYFSYITLLTVGYGDVTPFGLSKGVAIVQAFIGSTLPFVMILNYIILNLGRIKTSQK